MATDGSEASDDRRGIGTDLGIDPPGLAPSHPERDAPTYGRGAPPAVAAIVSTAAFVVPYVLSRSTTPSPDHPRIFAWYRLLRKPWFKPPDVVIPIAWIALETGLAYGGFRLMRKARSRARDGALALWAVNVFGIGGWNRVFFGRRDLPASTAAAAALAVTSAAYVVQADRVDRRAAATGAPLVGWVIFATILTAALWRKNR